MARFFSIPAILVLILILSGCAGSDIQPVIPPSDEAILTHSSNEALNSHSLWGYWQCALDNETHKIAAVPARTALLHINAAGPLNSTLGMSVTIDPGESDFPNGLFVLTVDLTHPFADSDNLTGFDVRGIMVTTAGLTAGDLPLPGENDPKILNADGYTRWWNPTEFPVPGLLGYTPGIFGKDPPTGTPLVSAINPYMQFADGLYYSYSVKHLTFIMPTSSNGRGVFRSGATNSRLYRIQFPVGPTGPKVYFNYAVDASWAKPSNDPPSIPNDFPLNANGDEAFYLEVLSASSTLWAAGGPQAGGELVLEIECWDWQGWLGGYDSEIGALKLVSPFCEFEEGVVPEIDEPGIGNAILTATVTGMPSIAGEIPVWVGITVPGSSYYQGSKPAPDEPVTAYTLITVEVSEAECQDNDSDDCSTAWEIEADDFHEGLLCLDVDDSDWYHFTVLPGGSAEGTIHLFAYDVGDLNMFLYEGCPPSLIDYSSNTGNMDEEITLAGLGPGEYYIDVMEFDDGDNAPRPYGLETSLTGMGEDCTTDNNNDPDNAEAVSIDAEDSGTVCLVGDPVDWYTFEISDGVTGIGTIELDNDNYANNDIAVYDETIGDPLYVGNSPGTADELFEVNLDSGVYFIRIDAMDDEPSGDRDFTLTLDIEEVIDDCDNADGNNTYGEAETIGLQDSKSGTVCHPSDPDWFTFDVPPDGVDGTITLSSISTYDNDLALFYDPTELPIEESAQIGPMDEVIEVNGLVEGVYFIKATASPETSSVNQDYILTTDLVSSVWGPTDLWIHPHIVRTNQGTNPATTPEIVQDHYGWANEFYSTWADGSVNLNEITYIDYTAWLSLTTSEAEQMFNEYGTDNGALNVFYVNDLPDMPGAAAYCWMECQFINQDHETGFVIMSDYADDPVLAHEMGHGCGLFSDVYLLDFYDCDDITWCPTGPTDIFCLESDAAFGNLMYWPIGSNIEDYWISIDDLEMLTGDIDSQAENMMCFNTNYPNAFFKP